MRKFDVRKVFLVTVFMLFGLSIQPLKVSACDWLGCFLGNHERGENVLALVTVTEVNRDSAQAVPEHIYQRTNFLFWFKRLFSIKLDGRLLRGDAEPKIGAHYFASLNCGVVFCEPLYSPEVDSADFRTAKLVQINSGDDAAVQWFMNGKGSDFYSEREKTFARTAQGDVEIYPNYPETDNRTKEAENKVDFFNSTLGSRLIIGVTTGYFLFTRVVEIITWPLF